MGIAIANRKNCCDFPDPPTLAFLEKKSKGTSEKSKGFSLPETPQILGKERNIPQKARKIGEQKNKEIEKKQGLEGQGCDCAK